MKAGIGERLDQAEVIQPEAFAGGRSAGAEKPLRIVDAFDFDEAVIPVRPWLVRGLLLRGHTHMIAAPGGSAKSLLTLQIGMMLAEGRRWGPWEPVMPCRTLIINAEDDLDEQRRRLAAARAVMSPDPERLRGMLLLADDPGSIVIMRQDETRAIVATPRVAELRALITARKIDALVVDPFAETFEGDENNNSEIKWAMKIWRDEIARPTGCAIQLVHHTPKYAAGKAGDADAIRGGGAIVNSTRVSTTLFPMTEAEAEAIGVASDQRNRYVRFDDAKVNHSLKSASAKWFEKISVTIGNGGEGEEPDEVGALKPWLPPSAFAGCDLPAIHAAIEAIDRGVVDDDGLPTGDRFTINFRKNSRRWVGLPIMEHMAVEEARARVIAREWAKNGLLIEGDHPNKKEGGTVKGLDVDRAKMPDHAEGVSFA